MWYAQTIIEVGKVQVITDHLLVFPRAQENEQEKDVFQLLGLIGLMSLPVRLVLLRLISSRIPGINKEPLPSARAAVNPPAIKDAF